MDQLWQLVFEQQLEFRRLETFGIAVSFEGIHESLENLKDGFEKARLLFGTDCLVGCSHKIHACHILWFLFEL